jgi:hypothetical protein
MITLLVIAIFGVTFNLIVAGFAIANDVYNKGLDYTIGDLLSVLILSLLPYLFLVVILIETKYLDYIILKGKKNE